jgi:hypothetical protein
VDGLYSHICPRYEKLRLYEMPPRVRPLALRLIIAVPLCGLAGCGTVNERLAAGVSDAIPAWAGGLPADAPPRPGTVKYDEYMKERERKRLLPASQRDETPRSDADKAGQTHEENR